MTWTTVMLIIFIINIVSTSKWFFFTTHAFFYRCTPQQIRPSGWSRDGSGTAETVSLSVSLSVFVCLSRSPSLPHTYTRSLMYFTCVISIVNDYSFGTFCSWWRVLPCVPPAYPRSRPARVAPAAAASPGACVRSPRRPPRAAASITAGRWKWRVTAPQRRRTPPRVNWKGAQN